MAGAFDDLIPANAKGGGAFDDLVPPEDKYRQAARKELKDKGLLDRGALANMTEMGRKGYTFGWGDEIAAAALTPIEMVRQGTINPAEAYRFAKAREDIMQEEAKKATGIAGMGAELVGGAGMGGMLAKGGATLLKPGQGALSRIGAGLAEGGLYGAVSGAGEAQSLGDVPAEALKSAVIGAGVGGGLTAAAPAVSAVGRNALGWASATVNPQGYAQKQAARALAESGLTPQQIAQEVTAGNAAGQPFTVADAMGNAGQRMLSNVTRAPGAGRTVATEFLENRQLDQGRRIAAILSEGFDAPQTAAQTREAMLAARNSAADLNYGAARRNAGAVDVSPAIQKADDFLQPGVSRLMNPGNNIADDSVEAAVRKARSYLTDGKSQVSDFDAALRAKMELDAMIERAQPTVQRQLIPVRNALDDQLAASSKPYAAARDQFRQESKAIEAIDTGRTAAQRGRTEDTTQAFGALAPNAQQGFRAGYVDPLIETIQGSAAGVNKARPFTSPAMQTELPTFAAAGKGQPMMERIGRENRMFQTLDEALRGSKTANHLNDQAAAGVNPEIIGNAVSGNIPALLKNIVGRSTGALSGYTPKVREELAKILLVGDGATLQPMLAQIANTDEMRRKILAAYLSGMTSGTTQASTGQRR